MDTSNNNSARPVSLRACIIGGLLLALLILVAPVVGPVVWMYARHRVIEGRAPEQSTPGVKLGSAAKLKQRTSALF